MTKLSRCVQCGKTFRQQDNAYAIYCNFCLDDPRSSLAAEKRRNGSR